MVRGVSMASMRDMCVYSHHLLATNTGRKACRHTLSLAMCPILAHCSDTIKLLIELFLNSYKHYFNFPVTGNEL